MDPSIIFIATAILAYLVWFCFLVQKLNGPKVWPIFGSLPEMFSNRERIHDWTTEQLIATGTKATYQTCLTCFPFLALRRGFSTVTCHPKNIEHILRNRFDNYPRGPLWQTTFRDALGQGLSNIDGEEWNFQRKMLAPEFAKSKVVKALDRWVNPTIKNGLWPILDGALEHQVSVDLQDLMLRFGTDNIFGLTLGKSLNSLSTELQKEPLFQAMETAFASIFRRMLYPNLMWKIMRFLCIGSEKKLKESLRIIDKYMTDILHEHIVRKENSNSKGDDDDDGYLSILMKKTDMHGNPLPSSTLKRTVLGVILAGRDSLAAATSWFFWLVMTNPHVEKKIINEMVTVLRKTRGDDQKKWIGEPLSHEEMNSLVYLQVALLETLRLYPSAPRDFRYVVSDDVLPDGTYVPSGSEVVYSIYSIGRMKSIWGEDCLDFKPERWLSADEARIERAEDGYKFAAFNGGPRTCIGKYLSYLEMKSAASAILLRYSLSLVPGHIIEPKLSFTLSMKNGLKVQLFPRDLARYSSSK